MRKQKYANFQTIFKKFVVVEIILQAKELGSRNQKIRILISEM